MNATRMQHNNTLLSAFKNYNQVLQTFTPLPPYLTFITYLYKHTYTHTYITYLYKRNG